MKTTIKVEGLRQLGESMRELGQEVALRISGAMTGAAAKVIKVAAQGNILSSPSVVTRSLHDSVIVKKIPKSQTRLTSEHIVTVRRGRGKIIKRGKSKGQRQTTAPHAGWIEFGTVNMPAEPYLRPAFDRNKGGLPQVMKATGEKRVIAAARKAAKGRK